MIKIVEVKNTLSNTNIEDNIYEINKIVKELINQTEFIIDVNKDDFDYINIVLEKIKTNLKKVYMLMKLQ